MIFAYADPPYPGMAKRYPENREVDHAELIAGLAIYDGWALSTTSNALRSLLPLCPDDVRVAAWTKSYARFAKNVVPAYTWEPVIFRRTRRQAVGEGSDGLWPRDSLHGSPKLDGDRAILGAKPPQFCRWVLNLLGYQEGDELVDLFPGTGVMGRVAAQGVLSF